MPCHLTWLTQAEPEDTCSRKCRELKVKKFSYSSVCCCLILSLLSLVPHKISCDTSLYISQICSSKKQIEWPFLSIKGQSASCGSCHFSVFLASHKYVCVNSLTRSLRFIPRPKIKPAAEWTCLAETPESRSEPPGHTCNPGIATGSAWNKWAIWLNATVHD